MTAKFFFWYWDSKVFKRFWGIMWMNMGHLSTIEGPCPLNSNWFGPLTHVRDSCLKGKTSLKNRFFTFEPGFFVWRASVTPPFLSLNDKGVGLFHLKGKGLILELVKILERHLRGLRNNGDAGQRLMHVYSLAQYFFVN